MVSYRLVIETKDDTKEQEFTTPVLAKTAFRVYADDALRARIIDLVRSVVAFTWSRKTGVWVKQR